jgi:hypothetical protein
MWEFPVQISYDGRYITTADGRSVRIWDAGALALVKEFPVSGFQVEAAAYCPTKYCPLCTPPLAPTNAAPLLIALATTWRSILGIVTMKLVFVS